MSYFLQCTLPTVNVEMVETTLSTTKQVGRAKSMIPIRTIIMLFFESNAITEIYLINSQYVYYEWRDNKIFFINRR